MTDTVFTPQLGDLYLMLALGGAVFTVFVFLAYRLGGRPHPDPRRRVLMPMLLYFFALLCLMATAGAFWSTFKYPEVTIGKQHLTIDGERYPRPRRSEVRFEQYGESGLGGPNRVLLVQTRDKRTWAFPEDRYDVNAMLKLLR